jgi:glucose-1-phosphate thymidylyltransferase
MPAGSPREVDTVELGEDGEVLRLVPKPADVAQPYAWICAVWTPRFTRFMHEFLLADRAERSRAGAASAQPDLPVGAVIQAAIAQKLRVHGVVFPDGSYLDVGTPENLLRAARSALAGVR